MKKTTLRQNVVNADREWYLVDANEKTLGELSVKIATVLRGKHRVDYTPHVDGGDYVIVLNAEKVRVTGNKEQDKLYYRHSGYLGNLKKVALEDVRERTPARILEEAVGGMLPKTKLRKNYLRRLFLVKGDKNPYSAQMPKELTC